MKTKLVAFVVLALLISAAAYAQVEVVRGAAFVSEPVVPRLTPALRDLPQYHESMDLFGLAPKERDTHGIVVPDIDMPPHDNPLAELQESARRAPGPGPNAFGTPTANFAGVTSTCCPPDTTGDVGPTYFLQGDNGSGGSRLTIYSKSGTQVGQWLMETLGSAPCNSGYCDPIIQYDELADRWMISEFDTSANVLCVYVSRTSDPTGQWWAYSFDMTSHGGMQDYPKYGIWPDGYYIGVNNGGYVHVLQRQAMLTGAAATSQTLTIPTLSGFGFQLTLPATLEGDAPPAGAPAIFARPVDTEIHSGYTCTSEPCDVMDLWAFHVDWATPASTTITHLPGVKMAEFDHTLCGTGSDWSCMNQPGYLASLDPIREPIHFPLQYRNWGSYETLVGAFAEDVNGNDLAAVHWFEMRKVSGTWSMYQEGVLGGDGIDRSVASAAMDGSGNIAVGYTRTGSAAPYYPSIYYAGRLSTDPLGTMPYYDNTGYNATTSQSSSNRWGDYAGIGVDPTDDCTFWFTSEYGGSQQTRVIAFKFDQCGCVSIPVAPVAGASAPQANRIAVTWNDSATTTITRYWVYRSLVAGGPYTQIAEVADTSPGVGGGAGYTYNDNTVSGGTTYYYVVKSNDGVSCTSPYSNEVFATATGACTLPPTFAGLATVTNPASATCTLNLAWSAGGSNCAGSVRYDVYRDTVSGFTPGSANRIAQNLNATSYSDLDNLVSGTTYYYIVRATDTVNSVQETNLVERSGVPTGVMADGTWFAGAETGNPALTLNPPWTTSTTYYRTGTHSYSTGASYPNSACGGLTTPSLMIGTGSVLTYYHIYSTESGWDGGRVEISTNGGSAWTALTPTPAYPGTMSYASNACTWAVGTSCYIGNSTGYPTTWQQGTIDLSTYSGQTVLLRWTFSSDSSGAGGLANPGWYVDDIQITHVQVPGTCATGSACANNPTLVDVTPNGPLTLCPGSGQLLTAGVTGGTGLTYQWYDGASAIPGATNPTYTANSTGTHAYNCIVKGSGCPTGLSDGTPTSITWPTAPTFAGLTSVTNPQSATCTLNLTWSPASSVCPGTPTYKVYRSTTTPVSTIPANVIASGVTGTSYSDVSGLTHGTTYYYVVHAVDGAAQEDANSVEFPGVPTGAISANNLLTEGFDGATFPPTGWTATVVGTSSTPAAWARVTTSTNPTGITPHGGSTAMAEFNSYHSQAGGSNRLARTATFNIAAGTTTATATLWVYHETGYTGNADQIQVQTSPDGTTWTTRGTVNRYDGTTGWKQHTISLAALIGAGNFRIGYLGVSAYGNDTYMDDVSIDVTTAVSCTTGSGCTAPGAPTLASAAGDCSGVNLAWSAGTGTTNSYNVYRSANTSCPVGTITKLNASPVTATTYSDATAAAGTTYTYVVRGACDAGGATESANSNCLAAARVVTPGAPAITGFSDPDACVLGGVTITYTGGSGATSHDLYRDGARVVTGYASGATYAPGDTTSHSYVVRAVNGSCFTNSGTQSGADAADAPPTVVNLRLSKSGADLNLSWDLLGVTVTKYEVWRSLTANGAYDVKVGETSGLVDGFTVTLAGQPANAFYLVRAVNGTCNGTLH